MKWKPNILHLEIKQLTDGIFKEVSIVFFLFIVGRVNFCCLSPGCLVVVVHVVLVVVVV